MTSPTRLRKREIVTAQLASGQPVGSTFSRGAGAALRLLTSGWARTRPGSLTVWRVQVLGEGPLELGQLPPKRGGERVAGRKGPQADHVRAV